MLGCFTDNGRPEDIEIIHRIIKIFREKFRDLPYSLTRFLGTFFKFILSLIRITHQVSDVCHVLNVSNFKTEPYQNSAQHIISHVLPSMPDMRIIIDRHAAGVEADLGWMEWNKVFKGFNKGIIEFHTKSLSHIQK